MVYVALLEFPLLFRGRRGVWLIANVAALMVLVRGSSREPSLDAMSLTTHSGLFALRTSMYFVWIAS